VSGFRGAGKSLPNRCSKRKPQKAPLAHHEHEAGWEHRLAFIPETESPMKNNRLLFTLSLLFLCFARCHGEDPAFWKWAQTPPMGWNSYDGFGDSVTEAEVMSNAAVMQSQLLPHGWNTVVVDYRWYDPGAHNNNALSRAGAQLTMDQYGRLLPAPNRFPSASGTSGFKPLADKIHAMGLKFGIHIMRGVPNQAVVQKSPIEGSSFTAADAANPASVCVWCKDMIGVDATKQAGRDYYDSIFRLYASWGLDFVKVDDLSRPYSDAEIEAIRSAIDKTGRPIVFSTSPGATPVAKADHVSTHANMWRVSDDFWDNWPDSDMIPFGKLSIARRSVGRERLSHFTHDEQLTLISLWSLMPSPLMLGGDLTQYPKDTIALITNDEVLALNQDSLEKKGQQIAHAGETEVWVKALQNGSKAIGLFNRGEAAATVTLNWADAGLEGKQTLRDLWQQKDLGDYEQVFSASVPPHGVVLLKAASGKPQ
jgi:alpha-galactosidase